MLLSYLKKEKRFVFLTLILIIITIVCILAIEGVFGSVGNYAIIPSIGAFFGGVASILFIIMHITGYNNMKSMNK